MISATRYRALAEINRQTALGREISDLQSNVSSGKRLTVPSDDPIASSRVSDIRRVQANQVAWTSNANTGASIAAAADNRLASVGTILDRAKDLVLAGRNDTVSAADRTANATELRSLADQIDNLAQSADPTGRPLFPTGTPISIPVSDTLAIPATASRDDVFNKVTTAAGTKTLSALLTDAADALEESDPTLRAGKIDASITALDAGAGHITQQRADQGVRAQRFDSVKDDLLTTGDQLKAERSTLEDTDLTYSLAEFQAKQLALSASQTLFAQTTKSSLFDMLG